MKTHWTLWKKTAMAAFFAALVVATAVPAIELPDIGDPSGTLFSPAQERKIGQAFLRQLRQNARVKVVDDPEVEAYVQALGSQLAAQSDNPTQSFEFFLVDDGSINAFAVPGGFIGVHTGLLLNAATESELAGVLAHEIAHVTQKHMARAFEKASQLSIPMAAAMLGAILIGTQNPEAGQAALAAVSAGNAQMQIDFTRANEEEADRVGMQILVNAGLDPQGMPAFFEKLQRANRYTDDPQLPEFLRTHPVTVSRVADSRNRAERYPKKPYQDSLDFLLTQTKIKQASIEDPSQAVNIYEQMLKPAGAHQENATRYGYALALTRAGRYPQARLQLGKLRQTDPERLAYLLASARLAMTEGNHAEGLQIYTKAQSLFPDYRPVALGYAQALLTAGKAGEARQLLRRYISHHEPDLAYYDLLADAEGKAGSQVEAHIATAEGFYLEGETELACKQLRFAQRSAQVDHYQRERIEARLKTWADEVAEEVKDSSRFGPSFRRESECERPSPF
jgi:predicted Zn-dependent protease